MKSVTIILLSLVCLQAQTMTSVNDYIDMALKANKDIRSAQYALDSAKENARINSALPDPMLMIEGRGIPADISQYKKTREWMVMISQPFPFPGKLGRREQKSTLDAKGKAYQLHAVKNRIIKISSQLFFNIAYIDRMLDIYGQQIEWMQSVEEIAETRYAVARASRQEWLKSRIVLQRLSVEKMDLEKKRLLLSQTLNRIIGRRLDEEVTVDSLTAKLPSIPDTHPDTLLYRHNPLLLAAANRKKIAEQDVHLAKLSRYPDVSLMGGIMIMNNMDDRLMARISMTLPFLPWSGKDNRAGISQARIVQQQRRLDYHDLGEKFSQQALNLMADLKSLKAQKQSYEDHILPSYLDLIEWSISDYESGNENYISVVDTIRELLKTEKMYWSLIYRYLYTRAELEFILGINL